MKPGLKSVTRLSFNQSLNYLPIKRSVLPFDKREKRQSGLDIYWQARTLEKVYPGHIIC